MEDTRWLRIVTIGLVLAAMAVGYFLLAQRFTGTKVSEVAVATPSPQPTLVPTSSPTPTSIPVSSTEQTTQSAYRGATSSAYTRIVERTKGGVTQLPATGFPAVLTGILAVSAIIAGLGLRKFPH